MFLHCFGNIPTFCCRVAGRMITVMLVDDQELIRIGLKAVLSRDPAIEVVADLDNGLDALRQARALRPDVVVVDVDMPELSGVEVTARLVALSHPPQGGCAVRIDAAALAAASASGGCAGIRGQGTGVY